MSSGLIGLLCVLLTPALGADNIGAMFTCPDPSDSEGVAEYMADAIRAVRAALDDGVSFADSVLEGLDRDAHVWAHLVRYRAVAVLRVEEVDSDWGLGRELKNSGIEIVRGPFVMRVYKSQDGAPPHPGASLTRRRFWSQLDQLTFRFDGRAGSKGLPASLILDWSVDEQRVAMVALSKPAGIWTYQQRPRLEWRVVVPTEEESVLSFEGADEELFIEFEVDDEADDHSSRTAEGQ